MQSVLITGGSGSLGYALVRHYIQQGVPRICIYSRDEQKQHRMAIDFGFWSDRLRYFIGDVRDAERLEMATRGIDLIVHAAALKIIPVAEYNPFECANTNVIGSENVVRAAIKNGVRQAMLISSDKAVNPVNLYGATKLAAEKIFLAANNLAGAKGPLFSVCRYGNVIGSRGSIIPQWKTDALMGVPLKVTDRRMTRFWITMDQAVDFVTSSIERKLPKVFVPKIPSMVVYELARSLSDNIEFTGIRPGEKLAETLISADEQHVDYIESEVTQRPYTSDNNTEWLTPEQMKEVAGL